MEDGRRIDLERRKPGGEHGLGEAGREAAGDHGDHARGGQRARRLPAARPGAELLARDQHVARAELRGERGVEVGEQAARALGRGQEREAGGQDVGRREVVGEGPGTAGEHRQPDLAPRGHAGYESVRCTTRPKAQRGLGRTVTRRPGWRRMTHASSVLISRPKMR